MTYSPLHSLPLSFSPLPHSTPSLNSILPLFLSTTTCTEEHVSIGKGLAGEFMMRPEEREDTQSPSIPSSEVTHSGVGDLGPDSTVDAVKGSVDPVRLSQLCEGRVTRYAPPSSSSFPSSTSSSSSSSSSSTCTGGELAGQTQGHGHGQGQGKGPGGAQGQEQGQGQGQGHPEEEGLYETVWNDGATLYFGEVAYQNARVLYDKIAAEKIVLEKGEQVGKGGEGGQSGGEGRGQEVRQEHAQGQQEDIGTDFNRKRKFDDVAVVTAVEVDQSVACKAEEGGANSDKINLELQESNNGVFNVVVNEVEEGGVDKKARINPDIESVLELKDQVEVDVEVGDDVVVDMMDGDIDEDDHLRIVADSVIMGNDDEDDGDVDDDDDDDDDDDIEGEEGGEGGEEGEGEEGDVDIQDSEDIPLPLLPLHSLPLPTPLPHPSHPFPNPHPAAGGQVLTPLLMRSKYSVPYETVLKWR
jgi:hypothetical protein